VAPLGAGRVRGGSPLLEAPRSPQPYFKTERRGNPNLGRETKAQKSKRMGTWREQNLLMKEESLHIVGSVLEALGVRKNGLSTSQSGQRWVDVASILDNDKPTFWR
jgi:hypothetical protein